MDPAKLPAVRAQIWTLIQAAKMDHDLGLADRPHDAEFDDFILHVDGWLCEIKDAQIRDGLHVLGAAPVGEARVNLVLAMLRASPGLGRHVECAAGAAVGAGPEGRRRAGRGGRHRGAGEALVQAAENARWMSSAMAGVVETGWDRRSGDCSGSWSSPPTEIVPRLAGTTDELTAVLHALDGGFVPAGPSGSPLRGLINVLPTGRNFYSVDPKAVPVPAGLRHRPGDGRLVDRPVPRDTGDYPRSVGLSVWGTSAMRTAGDDIAEVLALIGVRRCGTRHRAGSPTSAVVPLDDLARPRIDVTVRISGFFRDAFPHVVTMLDDAVRMVADLDEPDELNYVRAHAQADLAEHGDDRRATTRIFGSAPGAYGAGLLPLIESGNWRDDADLAEVYTAWGGFAYGRGLDGRPARVTWRPTTGGSPWRPRTPTPASTTSPTPTTISSTTAGWSPRCGH